MMGSIAGARTRRHFFKLAAACAASTPFIASAATTASAKSFDHKDREFHDRARRDFDHNDRDLDHKRGWDFDHKDRDFDHKRGWDFDQHNGDRTADPSCFLKGTRIATPLGEIQVEELVIGDNVCTLDGVKPVKWIGYRRLINSAGKAWNENVIPIRVSRFAIDHTPHRDLFLSPQHCLFIDGCLIPVNQLINETTIVADIPSAMECIEYYHVEFERHEVIYAEGTAVESYLGTNRERFSNFEQYERLYRGEFLLTKRPFAPILGYHGGRDELKGLIRSLVSIVVDIRDPVQVAWDRLAERSQKLGCSNMALPEQ